MANSDDPVAQALLQVPAESFIADTAVKLDRLLREVQNLQGGLSDHEYRSKLEIERINSKVHSAIIRIEQLCLESENLASKIELKESMRLSDFQDFRTTISASATKHELAVVTRDLEAACLKRHNSPEDDYERLRIRVQKLEKSQIKKYDTSWLFGASMFISGLVCCAIYFLYVYKLG